MVLMVCALLVAALPAAAGDDSPSLALGYVQSIVYRGERLTLTAHVQNPSGESREVVLRFEVTQSGKAEPPLDTLFVVNPNGMWYQDVSAPLPDARQAPVTCKVTLLENARTLSAAAILVTAPTTDMPRLTVQGTRLLDPEGRSVVLQIEQRPWIEDRSWAVLKMISEKATHQKCKPSEAMVITDVLDGSDRPDGYWRLLNDRLAGQGVRLVGCSQPQRSLDVPALGTLAAFSQADLASPVKAAVIFLGTADKLTASEPRLVSLVLEAIMQRLEAAGCKDFSFLLPIAPSPLREEIRPYVMAVLEVSRACKAASVNLPGKLGDGPWLAGGGLGASVYRSQPDPGGQKVIFETLYDALAGYAQVK